MMEKIVSNTATTAWTFHVGLDAVGAKDDFSSTALARPDILSEWIEVYGEMRVVIRDHDLELWHRIKDADIATATAAIKETLGIDLPGTHASAVVAKVLEAFQARRLRLWSTH